MATKRKTAPRLAFKDPVPSDDYILLVFQQTDKAWMVGYEAKDREKGAWLPKSQVIKLTDEPKGQVEGWDVHEFNIPDWLAEKTGLV